MSRACTKTYVFTFLAMIFAVPVLQGIWEKTVEGESLRALGVFKKEPSEANLRAYEKELEEASKVAGWLRPLHRQLRWWVMRDLGDKAVCRHRGDEVPLSARSPEPGSRPVVKLALTWFSGEGGARSRS